MKLCAVQYAPVTGDVEGNVKRHVELIELAATQDAELIFFPELSLTGYEPTLARGLATHEEDPRLDVFQRLSDAHAIVIGVGLTLVTSTRPQIGMVVFQPRAARQAYAKQHLHDDELPYFSSGGGRCSSRPASTAWRLRSAMSRYSPIMSPHRQASARMCTWPASPSMRGEWMKPMPPTPPSPAYTP
nr:carbon-nitrogen hydrolase family protein [Halomonas montanilacus]